MQIMGKFSKLIFLCFHTLCKLFHSIYLIKILTTEFVNNWYYCPAFFVIKGNLPVDNSVENVYNFSNIYYPLIFMLISSYKFMSKNNEFKAAFYHDAF